MADPAHPEPSLRWRWLLPAVVLVVLFHFLPIERKPDHETPSIRGALDRAFFDAASRHPLRRPSLPENSAVVLVNNETLALLGRDPYRQRWPLPRAYFAALIAALDRAGAERIVMDFIFFNETEAEQDALLAAVATASPKVVLAATRKESPVFWHAAFLQEHAAFFPQPRIGFVEFPADVDGVARAYAPVGSLAERASPVSSPLPGSMLLRWHGTLKDIEARDVPVVPAGHFFVAGLPLIDRLSQQAPDLSPESMSRALAAEPALAGPPGSELAQAIAKVRGRVVFVGANADSTFDLKPFPVGKVEPGVLMHWTAWTNLVADEFITALAWPAVLGVAALAGCVVFFAGRNRSSMLPPLAAAVAAGWLVAGGAYAGMSAGWFLAPATPLVAVLFALLGVVAENFWREQQRKREIQSMFGAYVDPVVVANLVRDPTSIRLAGERREATVFFSDLVGFTELSETLQDKPEQMVEVVNAYLDETSECLHREGAYVDKYIGDAVMAVLGAPQSVPDHALAACRAALEAQRAIVGINARYAAPVGVRLAVRIGLNTGEMILGNLGSARKKQYTAMGDTVNLASRLEGANKAFGTGILIGEETARRVQGAMITRPLARLKVKGKHQAIEVHTLHGATGSLPAAEKEFVEAYCAGYAALVERRYADAVSSLSRALLLRPDDVSTSRWHTQASIYVTTPPPPDWEPVVSLESK